MDYKDFLKELLGIKEIDFGFPLNRKEKERFAKKIGNIDLLNNLAFVPVKKDEKKEILSLLEKKDKEIKWLNPIIEKQYDNFMNLFSKKTIRVEKYMNYFYDWIMIVINDNMDLKIVKRIKKNVYTNNLLFWYYLLKKLYITKHFEEVYFLSKYIKKSFISEDNYLFDELILYEFVSLKKSKDYIYNNKWLKKLCALARKLKNFDILKITTILECNLLKNQIELFRKNFYKHESEISDWIVPNILNVYELSVYAGCDDIVVKVKSILDSMDIQEYKGAKEYLIYKCLNSIEKNDKPAILSYIDSLKDDFDFKHLIWFYKIKHDFDFVEKIETLLKGIKNGNRMP